MSNFVFFGTSAFSVYVLEALSRAGQLPNAVVTFPDAPKGRSLALQPNIVKSWALAHSLRVVEATSFKKDPDILSKIKAFEADVFVVASFGKILPDEVIYSPRFKTLNVHPSLLPKLRGPAPIQNAILHEQTTGVTIMRLDAKMDEGPIVAQKEVPFPVWPIGYNEAERLLGQAGGELLAGVLPQWTRGELQETAQNGTDATYTKMIEKMDADISNDDPETAYKKILAYEVWPRARKGDLIITKAHLENGALILDKVIPPGKKEMNYGDYLRGNV